MTVNIHTFPVEWYENIVSQSYPLRSLNQVSSRPFGGGQSVAGPHTQLYMSKITFREMRDPLLQDIDAFFKRARGRANAIRIAHGTRLRTYYDRNIIPTTSGFRFVDGTGFAAGYLPPEVYVATAAARGARYLVLGGFPVSTANVLRQDDPFEIKPNGIPAVHPHRYTAAFGGSSDATGRVGIEIEPGLRAGVAAGDTVALRNAASVFRMIGDDQFETEYTGGGLGTIGGSLIEALELVP